MIKVFIPTKKRKYNKPNTRGFWRDRAGKIYYDYITIKDYNLPGNDYYYRDLFFNYLDLLKNSNSQECIFYIEAGQGFIYYNRDNIELLSGRDYKEVSRDNLKNIIKTALKDYSGVTIYKVGNKYFKDIFYK